MTNSLDQSLAKGTIFIFPTKPIKFNPGIIKEKAMPAITGSDQ